MSVKHFAEVDLRDHSVGGKALGLAKLSQMGFPVPSGVVIEKALQTTDWPVVLDWWRIEGFPPLAVRSSGGAEDSAQFSFAGQNQTFLNVKNESDLKMAIEKCFASGEREASQIYRTHFLGDHEPAKMNVVLQKMVDPLFSGVFFSRDPRTGSGEWILEVVPGYGEKLVSGKVTPGQVLQSGRIDNLPTGFTREDASRIVEMGLRVAESEGYPLDMEWGMDQERRIFVLQSRPITTLHSNKMDLIHKEMERLKEKYSIETLWDGQTFSEWSGFPSYFTFSIWKNAFSPNNAFGRALSKFGYQSFEGQKISDKFSLLERVFGRAYVNLDRLSDLYYGPIPYKIESRPRPHTKFDWHKLNLKVLLHTPKAIWRMMRVAWNLSIKRSEWLHQCREELQKFRAAKNSYDREVRSLDTVDLQKEVLEKSHEFSREHLYWPLVLVVLTESTLQRLQMILSSVVGSEDAQKKLRDWMGQGLHTVTASMREEYQKAAAHSALQTGFLHNYGHRCPGEMDLANPRWFEIGTAAFGKDSQATKISALAVHDVEKEISELHSFKREVILEEWRLLKQMLELREEWKMEILKPYAQIRILLNELGDRWGLGPNIHWLRLSEIENESDKIPSAIESRKQRFEAFKEYHFPALVSLRDIEEVIEGQPTHEIKKSFDGEALSSGIVRGQVRVVRDVSQVHTENWPEDTVLVAETTDPGWTPLFIKSRAVVVQNGGVLSHCAIVAREMGIPAVSGIVGCHTIFKDGDILWVDGNKGRVFYESMA